MRFACCSEGTEGSDYCSNNYILVNKGAINFSPRLATTDLSLSASHCQSDFPSRYGFLKYAETP